MPTAAIPLTPQVAAPADRIGLRPLIDIHSSMLAQPDVRGAANALADATAKTLAFDRVCVGWVDGESLRLIGSSGTGESRGAPAPDPLVSAAMFEALDQHKSVFVPEPATTAAPSVVRAQQALLQRHGGGSVVSVPMRLHGKAVGALTGWRSDPAAITAAEIDGLEYLGGLAGPVLELMRSNERPAWQRARDALAALCAGDPQRGLRSRPALIGFGVLLGALALVPMGSSVGGHARLEGAVQRVLVAPADGFLRQVNARPGDEVRAGQTLVEFAQEDLQLDRTRWASQLAQHENSLAGANARRDRAQLVINQSRAAEAQAQLALVDAKIERSAVEAPFDGLVVRGDLSQQMGAPVQQGAELMTIASRDRYRVIVEVDERDIAAVQVGAAGKVTLSALPWDTLPLRVTRIAPMATAVEGANVFEVEAELLAHPADLRPGWQGSAHIEAGRAPVVWSGLHRAIGSVRLGAWKLFG